LREFDKANSAGVTRFVAISEHVRKRIQTFYGRDADVVYPPVDTDFYTPLIGARGDYDLIVSALVPYKKVDLAVRAYAKIGFPLKIVGTGTEFEKLRASAPDNVHFLGWKSDEDVREYYRRCRFLIFPGEEDFGIVPVEAQACGRPVIAFRRGGLMETIVDSTTGIFFDEQNEASLTAAVKRAESRRWDVAPVRANAERFSVQRFIDGIDAAIRRCDQSPA
jgi:glycosyltransferase involved in cell wall biosynthesis